MHPIKLMKFWRQFTVLVQRNLRLILNDKLTMASLILQAPFMVLVIKMVVDPDCFTSNLINIGSRTALFIISAMAAFTAASRIDDFAYTPQQNIAHARAAVGEHTVKRDKTAHGQAVLGLVVVDGVTARDGAAGLDALVGAARQNLTGNLNAQAARDAQQVHGMARPPAHGVDVRQRVGRGDLAKQKRVVDHRWEEVDGLHESQVLPYAEDARIVGGIEPHEQVVVMHIG